MKTAWLFLFVALMSNFAQGQVNRTSLIRSVETTIASVRIGESSTGPTEVVVLANSDNRPLVLKSDKAKELDLLLEAAENGWEVRLHLTLAYDNKQMPKIYIQTVDVISKENKLTSRSRISSRPPVEALVTKNSRETQSVFDQLYKYEHRFYDVEDNCYNRAHFWARSTELNQESRGLQAGTDKVFIFFSDAYRKRFKHKWWYHVAPVIYQETLNGSPTAIVMDPTFIPDRALTLRDWLATFDSYTRGRCKEIQSLDDYDKYSDQAICMYAIGNMYTYVPTDLDYAPMDEWRCSDFRSLMKYPAPGSKPKSRSKSKDIKWTDSSFVNILPTHCRK